MKCASRCHIFAGFTIVETLVVISIITLLLSISMPSFSKARRLARAAICLSNLDQLQSAQLMYSDENKGLTKNLSHAPGEYWHHSLAQYLGDPTYRANANLRKRSAISLPLAFRATIFQLPGGTSDQGGSRAVGSAVLMAGG